ncbi:M2 family metallopeptidase [Fictibacillus sp. KIGAM418]|uniref:M2 family metallopeptidase n=1 Tax=Fictibacillus marinisediminis TaxID=2878389 RepID=A0A9X1XEJ2_9BACL|nr:M2 family metallopeptidase [Fictibacillus marinisediminis]MCK6259447.1 M2 family metallopeptidase [Fictibacillus marinisediminis]
MYPNISSKLLLLTEALHTQYKQYMYALWMTLTTNDDSWKNKLQEEGLRYNQLLLSDSVVSLTQSPGTSDMNYSTLRQISAFKNEGLEVSCDTSYQGGYMELWNKVTSKIFTYKTFFKGRAIDENEVLTHLQTSTNSKDREQLWMGKMKLGDVIEGDLLELVSMRNKIAQEKGFSHFYELKLKSQELELDDLTNVIHKLREHLDEDFTLIKSQIDNELKDKFNLQNDPMPWHYNHPFFQETHVNFMSDKSLTKAKVIKALQGWFSDKGLDIQGIVNRSKISNHPHNSTANYCLNIDREEDIRISSCFQQNQKSVALLLHELGHALYEFNISPDVPFILRKTSQPFINEAVALYFERLAYKKSWFTTTIGQTTSLIPFIQSKQYFINTLLKLYEAISVTTFEYELYANPSQNLNKLWWDIVEDTQRLKRPDNWDHAYWANKTQLTTLPVHSSHSLFGEVLSSQFHVLLHRTFGDSTNDESLRYLKENIFSKGNSVYWKRLLFDAFKSDIMPEYLIHEIQNNIRDEL